MGQAVMHFGDPGQRPGGAVSLLRGDVRLGDDRSPGDVTFYVETDDIEPALARAAALGGRVVAGPVEMPDGHRWAQFADPEGKSDRPVQHRLSGLYRTG